MSLPLATKGKMAPSFPLGMATGGYMTATGAAGVLVKLLATIVEIAQLKADLDKRC